MARNESRSIPKSVELHLYNLTYNGSETVTGKAYLYCESGRAVPVVVTFSLCQAQNIVRQIHRIGTDLAERVTDFNDKIRDR